MSNYRVKVSIALHSEEPPIDGNQRTLECHYQGYNRQYGYIEILPDGNALIPHQLFKFPACTEHRDMGAMAKYFMARFFSIGVAVAPGAQGGSIIHISPIVHIAHAPVIIDLDVAVELDVAGGIYKSRLDEMRADGRFFDSVEPDYEHGLNLPD